MEIEKGSAEFKVTLSDGNITITRNSGHILHEIKDAEEGSFDKIWETIRSLKSVPKNKRYKICPQIGKVKYSISFHDGISKHNDGSDFFDVRIFKRKKELLEKEKELKNDGYVEM